MTSPSISSLATENYGKLKVENKILHDFMLLMVEELEESINTIAPTTSDRVRKLIKNALREFTLSTIKTVLTNVVLSDSKDVDMFEDIEEPFDEELDKKAHGLENTFNILLEKRTRQRSLMREQLSQVGQHLPTEDNNTESDDITTPEPQGNDDIDWKAVENKCDYMAELITSIADQIPNIIEEYNEIKTIV